MRIFVTGSSGYLGNALVRTLRTRGDDVVAVDLRPSPFTTHVGSVCDADLMRSLMEGADAVIHTAALHKHDLATHAGREFVETNIGGTLAILEGAVATGVGAVVLTSSTTVFGAAARPGEEAPAAFVDEDVPCLPKNIYGVTKKAAEDLCEMFFRAKGLPSLVLRVSRFNTAAGREGDGDDNSKVNDFLYRRVDLADAVDAHCLAAERARDIGFDRFVISATSPFGQQDRARIRSDTDGVLRGLFPSFARVYERLGWKAPAGIDRVYVNRRSRDLLGWRPKVDFQHLLDRLQSGEELDPR